MKLPKILILFVSLVILTIALIFLIQKRGRSEVVSLTKKPEVKEEIVSTGETKIKVEELKEKYLNPKIATVRKTNWEAVGKSYLNFDSEADKTYFWMEIDDVSNLDGKTKYFVFLKERQKKENLIKEVGRLEIFEEKGYLVFEFEENGRQYNYLDVVVSSNEKNENEEAVVMRASFKE